MFEIGGSLREARLKRGLTPADVQKAIRIRDRYLQALEEERWELLPGDAYVKGFLRTYADYLGLDGSLYVEEYNSRFSHPEEQAQLVPQRFAHREVGFGGVGILRPLIAIGAIVAVVAAVAAWQLSGSSDNGQNLPPTTTPGTTGSHHHHTGSNHTQPNHTQPKKQHKTHTTSQAALPTRATLVASRGSSWLWVRSGSASGPTVYEGTLLQGKTLSVSLKNGSAWIRIGDPPMIDVHLGGRIVHGLPTQVGNVLLTRSGIRPA
jgi:cytoskeletal protein RodZ